MESAVSRGAPGEELHFQAQLISATQFEEKQNEPKSTRAEQLASWEGRHLSASVMGVPPQGPPCSRPAQAGFTLHSGLVKPGAGAHCAAQEQALPLPEII